MTFATGFISAESAVMGRRSSAVGFAVSTMQTELAAPVSRTQMNLSLSIVTLVKLMNWGLIPKLGRLMNSLTTIGCAICPAASAMAASESRCSARRRLLTRPSLAVVGGRPERRLTPSDATGRRRWTGARACARARARACRRRSEAAAAALPARHWPTEDRPSRGQRRGWARGPPGRLPACLAIQAVVSRARALAVRRRARGLRMGGSWSGFAGSALLKPSVQTQTAPC